MLSAPALAAPTGAPAGGAVSAYGLLEEKSDSIEGARKRMGWSYVISGGIVFAGTLPAYYLSKDVFAQAVYSIGQTLGVAAIGYGSYLVLIDDDYTAFRKLLRSANKLGPEQREQLSRMFLIANAERARNSRKIRSITHGLTAALNLTSAFTSSQRDLKTALLFVGGINAVAALAVAFGSSEEEALVEQLQLRSGARPTRALPRVGVTGDGRGPMLAFQWSL